MSKFPSIKARQMEQALFRLGFVKTRQKGSHAFYRHADGRAGNDRSTSQGAGSGKALG